VSFSPSFSSSVVVFLIDLASGKSLPGDLRTVLDLDQEKTKKVPHDFFLRDPRPGSIDLLVLPGEYGYNPLYFFFVACWMTVGARAGPLLGIFLQHKDITWE
jgi:hypothetical protein